MDMTCNHTLGLSQKSKKMSFRIRRKPDEKSETETVRNISNYFLIYYDEFIARFLPAVGMTNRGFLDNPKV